MDVIQFQHIIMFMFENATFLNHVTEQSAWLPAPPTCAQCPLQQQQKRGGGETEATVFSCLGMPSLIYNQDQNKLQLTGDSGNLFN